MPKLKNTVPKLARSGNSAVVYSGGKKTNLGKWGTPEAQIAYHRFISEYLASESLSTLPRSGKPILLDELMLCFLESAKERRGRADLGNFKTVIEFTLGIYSGINAADFGPRRLHTVQSHLEKAGYARTHVNKLVNFVKAIYKWAVGRELVSESVASALKYVTPLKRGQTKAHENAPVTEVADETIERTLLLLLPTVRQMIQIQRSACLRPSEICSMSVGDLTQLDDQHWVFRPDQHKGLWRGGSREIVLGDYEMSIIMPRLKNKEPGDAVFSPRDTVRERRERDALKRKTPITPSQVARKTRQAKNAPRVGRFYSANTYAQCIAHAIERLNEKLPLDQQIPHWFPYQIRHRSVTATSLVEGAEAAAILAGHTTTQTTRRYDHSRLDKAKALAAKRAAKAGESTEPTSTQPVE